jgi:hypothetical protein
VKFAHYAARSGHQRAAENTGLVAFVVARRTSGSARQPARSSWTAEKAAAVAANRHSGHDRSMRVVASSNDPVRLSFLTALLADAGIETVMLDTHASITEGSAGAIQQRLMVAEQDFERARRILRDSGEC